MTTDTGERTMSVDEVIYELGELGAVTSRKYGYSNKWARVLREARNTIQALRHERDLAHRLAEDAINMIEARKP